MGTAKNVVTLVEEGAKIVERGGLEVAEDAAKAAARATAREAVRESGVAVAKSSVKEAAEAAVKGAVKSSGAKESVRAAAEGVAKKNWADNFKTVSEALGQNSLKIGTAGAGGWMFWKVFISGDGIDGMAKNALSAEARENIEKNGLFGGAQSIAFGENAGNDSLLTNLSRNFVGANFTRRSTDFINDIPDNIYQMYENIRQGGATPDGMPMQQYPMQQPYPQGAMAGTPNLFTGMDQAVGGMTGGRMNTWDMAQMLLAGYMMFTSRFGMLGKIGGLLTGHHAYQGMQQRNVQQQQMMMQPQQAVMQVQGPQQFTPVPVAEGFPASQEYAESPTVVTRHR